MADHLRQAIAQTGARAVIPNDRSRASKYPLDNDVYVQRHRIECRFSKLKRFRRVPTRYEKSGQNDFAVVTLAAIELRLR